MRVRIAAAILIVTFLGIYFPQVGHGFIKDDFRWVRENRLTPIGEASALLSRNVGFYRPMVAATFAANYRLTGLDPLGYGLTNLALILVDAWLLFRVARRLQLAAPAALFAAAVWLFNFHAVNMAVLWVSGRTALLVCAFALCAAWAWLADRALLAGVCCLLAMLSKEEAVLLPLLFSATVLLETPRAAGKWTLVAGRTWAMWLALGIYLALRVQSGAFGPLDAPPSYQFTLAPAIVGRNVLEYVDRGATVAAAASVVAAAISGGWARLEPAEQHVIRISGLWFGATYLLTMFLPTRSSLYALLPSIGTALAAGARAAASARKDSIRFRRAAAVLVALAVVLVPSIAHAMCAGWRWPTFRRTRCAPCSWQRRALATGAR